MAKSKQLYSNIASSTLAAGIGGADLSLEVQAGDGTKFPSPGVGEFFLLILSAGSSFEIVKCTARSTDTFTIVRGQESTAGVPWPEDSLVQLSYSAGTLTSFARLQDRFHDMATLDDLLIPSDSDSNSYLVDVNDEAGQPIVVVKESTTKWRFLGHSRVTTSSTVDSSTTTSITSAAINLSTYAAGKFIVQFTSGTHQGKARSITSIASTTVGWTTALSPAVGAGVTFEIYQSNSSVVNELTLPYVEATNTAEAITASYNPAPTLVDNIFLGFSISATNTSATPTFSPNGLTAKIVVKLDNRPLSPGDMKKECLVVFNSTYDRWVLLNPIAGYMEVHGTDVASAGTLNLDTTTGGIVDVTGTTTVTAITLSEGRQRIIRTTGVMSFTAGASLITPNGQDINAIPNDFYLVVGYAAGVVRIIDLTYRTTYTGDVPMCVLPLSLTNHVQSVTRYASGYGGTILSTEPTDWTVVDDCIFKGMYVSAAVAPTANITITLRKFGVDTTQTVTLNGATAAIDSAHPIAFAKGDAFSVHSVAGAIGGTAADITVAFDIVKPDGTQGLPVMVCGNLSFYGLGGFAGLSGLIASQASTPIPFDCVVELPGGASGQITLNGTVLDEFSGGTYKLVEAPRFQLTTADLLFHTIATQGGLRFDVPVGNTVSYPRAFMAFGFHAQTQNTTRYAGETGRTNDVADTLTGSATENEMQILMPSCKVKGLFGAINSVPAAANTYTITLRKNGNPTGITFTFTNAGSTSMSETATEVTFNGTTDLMSIESAATSAAGNKYVTLSLGVYRQ